MIIDTVLSLLNDKLYTPNEILLVSPWGEKSNIINFVERDLKNKGIEICNFKDSPLGKDGIRIGTIGRASIRHYGSFRTTVEIIPNAIN